MRRPRLVLALVALPAVLGALALAPAAAADTKIRGRDAFFVSAHAGTLVWSEFDRRGQGILVARIGDEVERLRARPAPVGLIPADVGLRPGGGTRAVYQRCFPIERCDIYRLDLPNGRERRLRSLSTRQFLELAPSVWGRTYVFSRVGPREAQAGVSRRGGLFVASGSRRPRRISRRVAVTTDLVSSRIAWAWISASGRSSAVYVSSTTSRRHCRMERGGSRRFVMSPVIDGEFVYWLRMATSGRTTIVRAPLPSRSCESGGPRQVSSKRLPTPSSSEEGGVSSIAVDGGTLYYAADGIFRADDPPPFP